MVIVNGQVVVEDGKLCNVDGEELIALAEGKRTRPDETRVENDPSYPGCGNNRFGNNYWNLV
jgi:hypothetical protein